MVLNIEMNRQRKGFLISTPDEWWPWKNKSWTRANNAKVRKSQSGDRHKSLNELNKSFICEFLIFKYMTFCAKVRSDHNKNMGIFVALSLAIWLKVYYLIWLSLLCKIWWKYSSPLAFSIYFSTENLSYLFSYLR